MKNGKRQSDIQQVPSFWPDTETVRNDMLDYGLEIEHADRHCMIETLEERGLLDNTVIVMTSDNGMPFPRCKAQAYDYASHMPLAIMWLAGIQHPGRSVDDMVSFIDFAPTFLELAGIPFETSGMQASPGRSLTDIFYSDRSGQVNPERDFVVLGKERHDYSRPNNAGYPIRGIVGKGYLYLYNYELDRWPAGNPELGYLDCDGGATKTEILNLRRDGVDDLYWNLAFGKRLVYEEFFYILGDRACLENLAADESHRALKNEMRNRMLKILREQKDPQIGRVRFLRHMAIQLNMDGIFMNDLCKENLRLSRRVGSILQIMKKKYLNREERRMKKFFSTYLLGLIVGTFSVCADTLELKILDGEYWWAGLSSRGYEMPYDASTMVSYDLWGDNKGNQAQASVNI